MVESRVEEFLALGLTPLVEHQVIGNGGQIFVKIEVEVQEGQTDSSYVAQIIFGQPQPYSNDDRARLSKMSGDNSIEVTVVGPDGALNSLTAGIVAQYVEHPFDTVGN